MNNRTLIAAVLAALILGVTLLNEGPTPLMAAGAVGIVVSVVVVVRTEGSA